jgi:hypothetical protein
LTTQPAQAASTEASEIFGFGAQSPAQFSARASNGYSIQVEGSGRRVTLSAAGPAGTATYRVPGRVSTGGIAANFGKRGRVDVRFKPSRRKKVETPPNRCRGKARVTRWGVFVGTIRFAGERGYTRLRRSRAPGRTRTISRWRCKPRKNSGADKPPGVFEQDDGGSDLIVLEVSNRQNGLEVGAISAPVQGGEAVSLVAAGLDERRKRMRISRFALEFVEEEAFVVDDALTTATLAPPPPFAGVGTFQRGADASRIWSGSLSVMLPGTPRISLVGPSYRTRLFRLGNDGIAKPGI